MQAMRQDFDSVRTKQSVVSHRRRKKAQTGRDRALHDAVCLNQTEKIITLMRAGANPARIMSSVTKDRYGRRHKTTALHMAVMENRIDAMRDMIIYEPPLDTRDMRGQTALHVAVHTGNVWMVDVLLRAGAARDVKTTTGQTPLEMIEGSGETGAGAEITRLFKSAEARDCQKGWHTDQKINVRAPLQLKKPEEPGQSAKPAVKKPPAPGAP